MDSVDLFCLMAEFRRPQQFIFWPWDDNQSNSKGGKWSIAACILWEVWKFLGSQLFLEFEVTLHQDTHFSIRRQTFDQRELLRLPHRECTRARPPVGTFLAQPNYKTRSTRSNGIHMLHWRLTPPWKQSRQDSWFEFSVIFDVFALWWRKSREVSCVKTSQNLKEFKRKVGQMSNRRCLLVLFIQSCTPKVAVGESSMSLAGINLLWTAWSIYMTLGTFVLLVHGYKALS